ncbi:SDR family NAD(P)-dependent oxidoreductase [Paraglaciecola arctica]|uniref:SDR family NAD(P)-dependent oxidoreductase n=1 Tax=Paraglaciecola arctica TaxID=1128911 RepID=UPI001C07D1D6|nr:glucose 1-dehydrogenase [Paraglaciecola arctica]
MRTHDRKLEGQVVLVTGAADGIGMHVAIEAAKQGATLVLCDTNSEKGNALAQQLSSQFDVQCRFMEVDVTDSEQVQALISSIQSSEGRLDCAVNNAGVAQPLCSTADCEETWAKQCFDTNLNGVFLCMKYQLQVMQQQNKGNIINVSSVAGLKASASVSAYSASKHGVIGLTKSAAKEYAAKNIRVNAVCPGMTDTQMVRTVTDAAPQNTANLLRKIPMNRFGKPQEIAKAIVWLSSDECEFITGHALVIDGGESCN